MVNQPTEPNWRLPLTPLFRVGFGLFVPSRCYNRRQSFSGEGYALC
jgi:hypothetical protein